MPEVDDHRSTTFSKGLFLFVAHSADLFCLKETADSGCHFCIMIYYRLFQRTYHWHDRRRLYPYYQPDCVVLVLELPRHPQTSRRALLEGHQFVVCYSVYEVVFRCKDRFPGMDAYHKGITLVRLIQR
jgi:hypothetical protein